MPSPPFRRAASRLALALCVAVSLLLTAGGAVHAGQPARQDAPRGSVAGARPIAADTDVDTSAVGTGPARVDDSCTKVAFGPRSALRAAVKACTTVRKAGPAPTGAATADAVDETDAGATAGASGLCAGLPQQQFRWTRTGGLCGHVVVTYTLYDSQNRPVGTALIAFTSYLALINSTSDPAALVLKEEMAAEVIATTGAVTSVKVIVKTSCDEEACDNFDTDWPWDPAVLSKGSGPVTGSVTYRPDVPPQGRSSFQPGYDMYVTAPNATPIDRNAHWTPPAGVKVRCDNEMGDNKTFGCVVLETLNMRGSAPALELSQSDPATDQAVAGIRFALEYLMGRNPDNTLLHGASASRAALNRSRTCGDSTRPFVTLTPHLDTNDPLYDQCDEFPFASTMEGGTFGRYCAEVIPVRGAGGYWTMVAADPVNYPITYTENCLRAHMPKSQNEGVGRKLSPFMRTNRIIEDDPYWLRLVP